MLHCLWLRICSDERAAWYSGWPATPWLTIHHPSTQIASSVTFGKHHNVADEVDRLVKVPPGIGIIPRPAHYYSKEVSRRHIETMKQSFEHICIV